MNVEPLDEFFESKNWVVLEAATGWSVARDQRDRERVILTVPAKDGERYRVLFLCDGYPRQAPSVAFVNDEGSKLDPEAWPRGGGDFFSEVKPPPNSFLCIPLTREGLAHHPDWVGKPEVGAWNPDVHSLMDLFNRVHRLLNGDHYQGRGPS